jgi:hypothetical protein
MMFSSERLPAGARSFSAEVNRRMRSIKTLLLVTALVETALGAALVVAPSPTVAFVLGRAPASPPLVMERILGAALVAIGIVCWLMRTGDRALSARPLVAGLLVYNVAVPALLAYAALVHSFSSLVLWPACALHLGLAVWGVGCLRTA